METDFGIIWENESMTLHANGFYNKIKDYIYTTPTTDSITTDDFTLLKYAIVQGDAAISGGDFGFDIHPKTAKWIDWKGAYSIKPGKLDAGGKLSFKTAAKIIGEVKLSKE